MTEPKKGGPDSGESCEPGPVVSAQGIHKRFGPLLFYFSYISDVSFFVDLYPDFQPA